MLNLIVQSVQERKARDSAERSVRRGIGFMVASGIKPTDAIASNYRSALLAIAQAIHSDNGRSPERLVSRDTANNAITHYSQNEDIRIICNQFANEYKAEFKSDAKGYNQADNKVEWLNENRPNIRATPIENGKYFKIEVIPHTKESAEGWDTLYNSL